MTADWRAAVYAVAAAVLGVLGVYGVVSAAESDQWLALVKAAADLAAAAAFVLAHRHTPAGSDPEQPARRSAPS